MIPMIDIGRVASRIDRVLIRAEGVQQQLCLSTLVHGRAQFILHTLVHTHVRARVPAAVSTSRIERAPSQLVWSWWAVGTARTHD